MPQTVRRPRKLTYTITSPETSKVEACVGCDIDESTGLVGLTHSRLSDVCTNIMLRSKRALLVLLAAGRGARGV